MHDEPTPDFGQNEQLSNAPARLQQPGLHVAAAQTKARAEVEASLVIAKRFPRNEAESEAKILRACQRTGLAEAATYEYSKGGTAIAGPSIHLAKEAARCWGNIQSGWTEIERRNGSSSVQAYAWDLETNTKQEITFDVKHVVDTKGGGRNTRDERELYELMANMSARRMRACILSIIPGDIMDKAVNACETTLKNAAGNEKLQERIKKMVAAFAEKGVTLEMIEKRLQHVVGASSEAELARLRRIYTSLRDEMSTVESWFEVGGEKKEPDFGQGGEKGPADQQQAEKPAKGKGKTKKEQPETPPPAEQQAGSQPEPGPHPPAEPPPAAAQPPAVNYVRELRANFSEANLREADVVRYLQEKKGLSLSVNSMGGCATSKPELLKALYDNWQAEERAINEFIGA